MNGKLHAVAALSKVCRASAWIEASAVQCATDRIIRTNGGRDSWTDLCVRNRCVQSDTLRGTDWLEPSTTLYGHSWFASGRFWN
jgi:hypothetical protein